MFEHKGWVKVVFIILLVLMILFMMIPMFNSIT